MSQHDSQDLFLTQSKLDVNDKRVAVVLANIFVVIHQACIFRDCNYTLIMQMRMFITAGIASNTIQALHYITWSFSHPNHNQFAPNLNRNDVNRL